jgi:hypothetical protein
MAPMGSEINLRAATDDPNYRLTGWAQGCPGDIFPTCHLTLTAATTAEATFVPISCMDLIQNGSETDEDCGGSMCQPCGVGLGCQVDTDCAGATACQNKICTNLPSCAAIHQQRPNLPSGAYTIDLDGAAGSDPPFSVYCDMVSDGGGWTMVYKLTGGINADVVGLWMGNAVLNDGLQGFLNVSPSTDHYMNHIVTNYWNKNGFTITDARVSAYTGGAEVGYVQFTNIGTDRNAWYSTAGSISKSTWTDIRGGAKADFSIAGTGGTRQWLIQHNYGGCPADAGWLVVSRGTASCPWESNFPNKVAILYSKQTTYNTWVTNNTSADVFTVMVR